MSDILIKCMEMPKEGTVIAIYKLNGKFYASVHGTELCPLVPVPPHGELRDKTALIHKIGENIDKAKDRSYDWWYACTVAYDFALAAPTIIPVQSITAEEENNDK